MLVQDAVRGDGFPVLVNISIGRSGVSLLTLLTHRDHRCRKKTTS
jgi:hypothetical protein